MKFTILATVLAATSGVVEAGRCRAGTYRCTLNKKGWETCSTQRNWVVSIPPLWHIHPMVLTPAPVVLGLVRQAKLLCLQLGEQVPLLHPQGHQPPLVKRRPGTSDTRAGWTAIRLFSAAAPLG
jgi:hypothetical protein